MASEELSTPPACAACAFKIDQRACRNQEGRGAKGCPTLQGEDILDEALKDLGLMAEDNVLLNKIFNLSGTIFDHKVGPLGVPLNILVGWYSKPEVVQFLLQHLYIIGAFAAWFMIRKRQAS